MQYTSSARIKVGVAMIPEKKLFCRLDGWREKAARELQRLKALSQLCLLEPEVIPVFEEATQTAADFLDAPICILGFMDRQRHWFKSAVGLSRIGLMNQLAQERQMPRTESLCTYVVESQQVLAVGDTANDPAVANSVLVQDYGIRAYLGVPLFDTAGNCLGAIAIMDLTPRTFTNRDIQFLQIIARWSMNEFEQTRRHKATDTETPSINNWALNGSTPSQNVKIKSLFSIDHQLSASQVKLQLLAQLTQELRTPLTSVLGMGSVLGREIYGPLTGKQKEYLEIIQDSGRYLLSLVNELAELGAIDDGQLKLNLTSVDIEMLCQQAINTLEEAANRREQEIRLSVEPGHRIWVLDKDKVRQLLYHLIFSVIQTAATGSIIRIHVSLRGDALNLTVWVYHAWLSEGLAPVDSSLCQLVPLLANHPQAVHYDIFPDYQEQLSEPTSAVPPLELSLSSLGSIELPKQKGVTHSRETLGLLLSCHLAELHGGQISIQGSPESGYRYAVSLPKLTVEGIEE